MGSCCAVRTLQSAMKPGMVRARAGVVLCIASNGHE